GHDEAGAEQRAFTGRSRAFQVHAGLLQLPYHGLIGLVLEVLVDALRRFRPNGRYRLRVFEARGSHRLQTAEVPCQQLCCLPTNMTDTEREQYPAQGARLAGLYPLQEVLRALLPHALELEQVFFGQEIDVSHVLNEWAAIGAP